MLLRFLAVSRVRQNCSWDNRRENGIILCTNGRNYRISASKCESAVFPDIDKYMTPFIAANQKGKLSTKEKKDIFAGS